MSFDNSWLIETGIVLGVGNLNGEVAKLNLEVSLFASASCIKEGTRDTSTGGKEDSSSRPFSEYIAKTTLQFQIRYPLKFSAFQS